MPVVEQKQQQHLVKRARLDSGAAASATGSPGPESPPSSQGVRAPSVSPKGSPPPAQRQAAPVSRDALRSVSREPSQPRPESPRPGYQPLSAQGKKPAEPAAAARAAPLMLRRHGVTAQQRIGQQGTPRVAADAAPRGAPEKEPHATEPAKTLRTSKMGPPPGVPAVPTPPMSQSQPSSSSSEQPTQDTAFLRERVRQLEQQLEQQQQAHGGEQGELRVSPHVFFLHPDGYPAEVGDGKTYALCGEVEPDSQPPCSQTQFPARGSVTPVSSPAPQPRTAEGSATGCMTPGSRMLVRSTSACPGPHSETNPAQLGHQTIEFLNRHFQDGNFNFDAAERRSVYRSAKALAAAAVRISKVDPRRRGAVVRLETPVAAFGDVHGNYADLVYFMKQFTILDSVAHTPLQYLFLGDYVDRGQFSVEVAVYLLALKCIGKEKVCLLRGNHDDPRVNGDTPLYGPTGFKHQCDRFFSGMPRGGEAAGHLFDAVNDAFAAMPLAAVIDGRVWAAHGGFPRYAGGHDDRLEVLESDDFPDIDTVTHAMEPNPLRATLPQKQLLYAWDCMWADPVAASERGSCDEHGFGSNLRGGMTVTYNNTAIETFLQNHGLSLLIRGHQMKAPGVELSCQAKVITVFTSSGYCGNTNDAGAVLLSRDGVVRLVTKRSAQRGIPPQLPALSSQSSEAAASSVGACASPRPRGSAY